MYPVSDAVADAVYFPEDALAGMVYVKVTVPVEEVVPLWGDTTTPLGSVIVSVTEAPPIAVPDEVTVTVTMTVEPLV